MVKVHAKLQFRAIKSKVLAFNTSLENYQKVIDQQKFQDQTGFES